MPCLTGSHPSHEQVGYERQRRRADSFRDVLDPAQGRALPQLRLFRPYRFSGCV